jgi:hypothetical protein
MDAGPVVGVTERVLDGNEKADTLLPELFTTGSKLLLDVLPGYSPPHVCFVGLRRFLFSELGPFVISAFLCCGLVLPLFLVRLRGND